MMKAFPDAPIYTSLFSADTTFPEFKNANVRTTGLDRIKLLRRRHRLAFPLLAPTFSRLRIEAQVVVCSSSGWAHGLRTDGKKIVYCYTPARWLYQSDRYLGASGGFARTALAALRGPLIRWDRRAAISAAKYVTHSKAVRDRIRSLYGVEAEVLPAPYRLGPGSPQRRVPGIEPGFFLCVARLLPYKNVDRIVVAFTSLVNYRLVVVGSGPELRRLRAIAGNNVCFLDNVADDKLAWLYGNCRGVVAASYEDYGLTPIEGAAFGKPSAVLRWGGFLDTVVEGQTGLFFDMPEPEQISRVVEAVATDGFDSAAIRNHAAQYSEQMFIFRLREIVRSEATST